MLTSESKCVKGEILMQSDVKIKRMRIIARGAVQGVGFRPFVYRVAAQLGLKGFVLNDTHGVEIEVEGEWTKLQEFLLRLHQEKPHHARITSLEFSLLDPIGYDAFIIRESERRGERTVIVLADIATCPDCLRETFEPSDRRFRYPFTNCTHCGPRFTIIEGLPYDRPNTTMKVFAMCPECAREYHDPIDRRFHAQPIACPVCGPKIWLEDDERRIKGPEAALAGSAKRLKEGQIVALKGLGGFQLLADAANDDAVKKLRQRKRRDEKPFALMVSSLSVAKQICNISELEERLLTSPEAPIVLLRRKEESKAFVAESVAPHNPNLGLMLPYTPLHYLLMHQCEEVGIPVIVCTSGNLSDEPICIDNDEARNRLQNIADAFLMHDRPIARHCDDSVARIVLGRELLIRRARGYAPLPLLRGTGIPPTKMPKVLAVGAHLKNTVALAFSEQIVMSQHIGDLETAEALNAFQCVISDLQRLYEFEPQVIACDLHPDYLSTQFAERLSSELDVPLIRVQHHHAHAVACMTENELSGEVLGVSWDGTGYGTDGTVWGGEFLAATYADFHRLACLRPFRLPGGEKAIKEPWRSALGLLLERFGENGVDVFANLIGKKLPLPNNQIRLLAQATMATINAPITTSAGRLFDAVAALCGLRPVNRFEGQAAMELEFALSELDNEPKKFGAYSLLLREQDGLLVADWMPLLDAVLNDVQNGVAVPIISARFHNALVELIAVVAQRVGLSQVVLSGGCFQNAYLIEQAYLRLSEIGFRVYTHQRIPPNDGGISVGQAMVAACQFMSDK